MKKAKSLLAVVLAAMLVMLSLPLSAFVAGAAAPADNYVILNDGSDKSTLTVQQNFFPDDCSTEIGTSPDGTHFNFRYHTTPGYNQWAQMDISVASEGPLTGTKPALVYYIDFRNIQNTDGKLGWVHSVLDSTGATIEGAFTNWQTCYFVSAIDGSVTTNVLQQDYWGLGIPGGFVGYAVVPLQLGTEYDYSQIAKVHFKQSDSPLPDGSPDAGKSFILDNFAFVKDMDAFMNDTQFGTIGMLIPSALVDKPAVTTQDGTATVVADALDGATSYDINVYNANGQFVTTVSSADGNATVSLADMGETGYLQVVANRADGSFAASSIVSLPVKQIVGGETYDLLADGRGDITTTFTAPQELDTVKLPDGHGMAASTAKGQYFEFKFDTDVNLADYEALACYVDFTDETALHNFVWQGLKTTAGAFLTGSISTSEISGGQYVYGISARDGSVVKFASAEANCIKMPKGFAGYIVFALNAGKSPVAESASALRLYSNGWHENNTPANLNYPIYVDNFIGIKNVESFKQLVAEDPTSFGYRAASTNVAPTYTQSEEAGNVTLTLTWDAVAGVSAYRVYTFDLSTGEPVLSGKDTVTGTTYDYTGAKGENVGLQVVALGTSETILLPVQVALGQASAPEYFVAADGSDVSKIANGRVADGQNTFEAISVEHSAKGVDNSTFRTWGVWDWSTFRVDVSSDYNLGNVAAYAFWADMSNLTINNYYVKLNLIDKDGTTLTNILAGEESSGKVNYLIDGNTGKVSNVTASNSNAVGIPKGFVGWVVIPVRTDTAEAQALDFNTIKEIQLARSGWVGTGNEHPSMDFDNFTVIENLAEFYSDARKPYKLGAMNAGAYNETGTAVANPALSVVVGDTATYTWDAMYDSSDNSAAKYLVNEYKVVGANYVLAKSTETTGTSYTTDAASDVIIQVVALSQKGGNVGTIVGASARAQGIGAVKRPTVKGATFNSQMQIRFKAVTPAELASDMTVSEYGMLMIPTQLLTGELTATTAQVLKASSTQEMQTAANYSADITGSELEGRTGVRISARAYVMATDIYGSNYTIYSADTLSKSINGMARAMATAVLGSEEAKALVTTWTDAVTAETTAEQAAQTGPALISGYDLAQFALANPEAVAKAAELNAK